MISIRGKELILILVLTFGLIGCTSTGQVIRQESRKIALPIDNKSILVKIDSNVADSAKEVSLLYGLLEQGLKEKGWDVVGVTDEKKTELAVVIVNLVRVGGIARSFWGFMAGPASANLNVVLRIPTGEESNFSVEGRSASSGWSVGEYKWQGTYQAIEKAAEKVLEFF